MVELRRRQAHPIAALGATIALMRTPLAPAGVPIIVASVAALLGLRQMTGTAL